MANNKKQTESAYSSLTGFRRSIPIILVALAVFTALCFITQSTGALGKFISNALLGLFSIGGYFIPLFLGLHAIFYASDHRRKTAVSRLVFSIITVIMISVLTHTISCIGKEMVFAPKQFYTDGVSSRGGGFIGGLFAFCLTKVFGTVGLIIITIVIFALYITYFFAGGKSTLSRVLLKILDGISDFFTSKKDRKESKKSAKLSSGEKRKLEALKKSQEALIDDEFFDVDNGLSKLDIHELGINEKKDDPDRATILQEKVIHKDKSDSTSFYERMSYEPEFDSSETAKREERSERQRDAYEYFDITSNYSEREPSVQREQSADDVFTSNFDPFDTRLNQELATRPSSKAAAKQETSEGITEFAEPVYNISPEDVELARRRADFEMKKKATMEAEGAYAAYQSAFSSTQNHAERKEEVSCADETYEEPVEQAPVFKAYEAPTLDVMITKEAPAESEEPIRISRTMLDPTPKVEVNEEVKEEESFSGVSFDTFSEVEEDEPDIDLEAAPEEDEFDSEEIPLDEQNEDVKEYRKLFSFLSDEDEENDTDSSFILPEVEKPEDNDEYDIPFTPSTPIREPVTKEPEAEPERKTARADYSSYKFPPISLLAKGTVENDENLAEERNQNAENLVNTLQQFGVRVSIKGIYSGPRITRYEIVPAMGVKVQSVMNLFNDIVLNLGAEGVRMEAPIPGKKAIGVEIPNKKPSTVYLGDLVDTEAFASASSKTLACLGKDVTGNEVFEDIGKMPHVLVAGATGMGKSVCINAILISILYKARPDEVKFIMIDPKKVEFNGYNGIPHLLVPVVTDVKQAAGALMWAVEQMEKRYELMEKFGVRKIDDYNARMREDPTLGEPLPKIVIVIDELNDIMIQVRKPAEDLIMSIAQKARAAGIHLIIGTQRPSVNVVTGTIKANIPSRISCKVASYQDSKTILEQAGAEKLLNNGDMLYITSGTPKPVRVQGAFVSDGEVAAIMKHLKSQAKGDVYDAQALEEINKAAKKCSKGGADDDVGEAGSESSSGYLNDQQFLDAVDLAVQAGKISTSLIQRKISVGYGKAAKFIDIMQEMGLVSEQNGQRPRDVLVSKDEWHEMLSRRSLD